MAADDVVVQTYVGVNAWVTNHNKNVYGADAEEFRPERWIHGTPEQLSAMERSFMTVRRSANRIFHATALLTSADIVRSRVADLRRQEHLPDGDLEGGTHHLPRLRLRIHAAG
jgi:cytochrome P450